MKINKVLIEEFARPELTYTGPLKIEEIEGGDVLINGQNQSGKTLCFNAILYCIADRVIELQRGHGNSVEIELGDSMTVFRGETGHKVTYQNESYGPEIADEVQKEQLGEYQLIERQFLHSHLRQLPLERLSEPERIELLLAATGDSLSKEIQELREKIEETDRGLDEIKAEVNTLNGKISRRKSQLTQLENQIEDWESLQQSIQEGEIENISERLRQKPEIESELNDLISKKRSLFINIKELRNDKSRLEELNQDTQDIIVDALEEFICPVCEGRVGEGEVISRLNDGCCPFCSVSRDISDIEDHLNQERDGLEDDLEEIEDQIEEVENERAEVKNKIRELKDDRLNEDRIPDIIIDKLSDHNHQIDLVDQEVREKVPELYDEREKYEKKLEDLRTELSNTTEKRMETADRLEELTNKKEDLQESTISNLISDFESIWKDHYQQIAPELERKLNFNEDGTVVLNDDSGLSREYQRRGDLSDAEITLLNISFALAINDWGVENNTTTLETIVLDEPFVRFDDDIQNDALSYLNQIDKQVILTSSAQSVAEAFEPKQTLELQRNSQSELGDFINE
ncbi:hypothetical protein Natpe_2720 [Natrinema pellirubrum DSM 15624]|uniref:Rad50/SbcC-type AAA domain-containing protein n=1 Tax=Natrinema pellirubrum (strain DSM 15624 / CIP 106293 / JCM 10476 / NCIMB 786 / 157) TaxID=797303 RepID=L0JLW1_NATP1|nr:hypothetical protein [Natrinema pellirubrum]AGB32525.1 hypothetical protein Natpe_2720 [Natrinema pellirubrum DSM 15624]